MNEETPAPGWRPLKTPGLMEVIGPLCSKRQGEGWRYALATGPQHTNPAGIVHGGTLTALLDHAMSITAWHAVERRPVVTVQMNTTFLAPAKPGDFLEVDVVLRYRSGSILFVDGSVTADGREVACASCVMKMVGPSTGEVRRGE